MAKLYRITFDVCHDDSDKECLRSIFDSLISIFGESVFHDVYDVMVYGETFCQLINRIKNNEKKHKKNL